MSPQAGEVGSSLGALKRAVGEVWYGMTLHGIVRDVLRERASREHLFILISFGDLLGVPVLPPYYTLRLLPFIVPEINNWRRRMLRERDLVDFLGG